MPHSPNCEHDADCPTRRKTVWLCGVCGRTSKTRMTVGDESCYLHAVEIYEDSIERDAKGQIVRATAKKENP